MVTRSNWRPVPQAILDRDEEQIMSESKREQLAAQERVRIKRATRLALKRPGARSRPSGLA